jgi:hypothetical protein
LCKSESITPTVRGKANLLFGKLSGDVAQYHKALDLFQQETNILGQCEALVLLLPKTQKNMKFVEMMVRACIETKTFCLTLRARSMSDKDTASSSNTIKQVEVFYGLVKEKDGYALQLCQDVWGLHKPPAEQSRQIKLNIRKVCEIVLAHLDSNIEILMGDKDGWETVQDALLSFQFHQKKSEQPFACQCDQAKLSEYIKACSLSLEMSACTTPSLELEERFRNLTRYNSIQLNERHISVIKCFPKASNILQDQLKLLLKATIHSLSIDNWMEIWFLSRIFKENEMTMNQKIKPVPRHTLSKIERHFFVPCPKIDGIEHMVPHYGQWVKFCQLMQEGTKAHIAVNILINYIEVIARI